VATAVPGTVEVLGASTDEDAAGLLVPPEDEAALSDALVRALTDAPLRARLAAAGLTRARAYGLDEVIRAHEALFALVREQAAPPPNGLGFALGFVRARLEDATRVVRRALPA
jgi:glycosyltransferase involved in cell wall biosynthesis